MWHWNTIFLMCWHLTCHNISVILHSFGCFSVITAVMKFWQRGAFLLLFHHNCFLPHLWTVISWRSVTFIRGLLLFPSCEWKTKWYINTLRSFTKQSFSLLFFPSFRFSYLPPPVCPSILYSFSFFPSIFIFSHPQFSLLLKIFFF